MNIYTPTYGNTTPIQGLNSLDTALSQITGAATPQVQQAYSAAQGGALQMQGGENQYANQQQQQATQQLVNPLYSQMGNIGQMFQLYLADQGLAQKYQNITGGTGSVSPYQDPALLASAQAGGQQLGAQNAADIAQVSQMTTPQQAGSTLAAPVQTTGQAPNPYLASPSDIIASAANAPQAPGVTTAEMAQPISGGIDMLSLINSLIGQQQGVAKDVTTQNVAQYQDKANVLQSLANLLGGELSNRATMSQNATTIPGTTQQAGSVFQSIIDQLQKDKGNQATENDVWNYINQHDSALRAQGVNVDELWKLHKDLASKVGTGGLLSGGKATSTQAKQQQADEAKIGALKGFGHLMDSFYKEKTSLPGGLGGIDFLGPTAKEYNAQKDIYTRQLGAALKASKATKTAEAFAANLPGPVTLNAEGSFKGHLSEILDANQLKLFQDKKGNLGITDYSSFDPKSEKEVNVDNLSIDQIRKLLSSL